MGKTQRSEPSDLQLISAIARVRTQRHEIEMEIE